MEEKMKLTIEGLKDKKAWEAAGIKLPAYDVEKVAADTKAAPSWVHFGAGNIFRIFIGGLAAYTFVWDLGDVGIGLMTIFNIIVILPMSKEALEALKEYEKQKGNG